MYLNDIRRHRLLSREDEQRLGALIDAGRSALESAVPEAAMARRQLVEANLRLVV